MTIEKQSNGEIVTLKLDEWLDSQTAPMLEKEMNGILPSCKDLTLDMTDLNFIDSDGILVILKAYKAMDANKGHMRLINVESQVMKILNLAGIPSLLTIE